MNTVIYDYKGSQISFSNGENVMINATEMAKFFGKRPVDWLQNQQTEDFLNELSKVRKSTLTDLVQVTKGGNNPGTWMHEDVAMEFARWLSPSFAIWCNDHIKELLRTGVTTVSNDDETILHAMTVLQQRVEENKRKLAEVSAEKAQLQLTTAAQQQELKAQAPKVEYFDKVIDSTGLLTVNMVAACFGISTIKLNKLLCQWGIQYKQSSTYFLYAKYREKGYTEHKPYPYVDSKGETRTRQHMFWTEKGKQFIIDLYTRQAEAERARRTQPKEVATEQSKKEEAAV